MTIKTMVVWWAIITQCSFIHTKNDKKSTVAAGIVGTTIGAGAVITKNINNNSNEHGIIKPFRDLLQASSDQVRSTIIIHYGTNSQGNPINNTINGNDFFKKTSTPISNDVKEIIHQTPPSVLEKINEAIKKQQEYIKKINDLFKQLLINVNYKIAEDYFNKTMKNPPKNSMKIQDAVIAATRKEIVRRLIKKMTAPKKNVFTDRVKKTTDGKSTVYIHEKTPLKKGNEESTIAIDYDFFKNSHINFNNNHDNNNLLDKIEEINSLCVQIIDLLNMFNTGEKKFFFRFVIPDNESEYYN